jgi:hypothetical protein
MRSMRSMRSMRGGFIFAFYEFYALGFIIGQLVKLAKALGTCSVCEIESPEL